MFVRHLAEQGLNVAKLERKPRRNVQYKDLGKENSMIARTATDSSTATAVSRIDNLEFLADVIPKTVPYKLYKERKAAEAAEEKTLQAFLESSQSQKKDVANASFDAIKDDMEQEVEEIDSLPARSTGIDLSVRGPRLNGNRGDDRQVLNGHNSDEEMH
jgi:hypothetical protein